MRFSRTLLHQVNYQETQYKITFPDIVKYGLVLYNITLARFFGPAAVHGPAVETMFWATRHIWRQSYTSASSGFVSLLSLFYSLYVLTSLYCTCIMPMEVTRVICIREISRSYLGLCTDYYEYLHELLEALPNSPLLLSESPHITSRSHFLRLWVLFSVEKASSNNLRIIH